MRREPFLADTPYCSISVVGWEPGQTSPIHSHPGADEIYHVLEGEGLFHDRRKEMRLGPGDTVIFPAGEVHRVQAGGDVAGTLSRPRGRAGGEFAAPFQPGIV